MTRAVESAPAYAATDREQGDTQLLRLKRRHRMCRALSLALGLGLALLGSAPRVSAHGELLRATPQPGSIVSTSPPEVQLQLQFTEGIEARFSGLEIAGSN